MSDELTTTPASTPEPSPTPAPAGQSAPVDESKSSVEAPQSQAADVADGDALPTGKETVTPKREKKVNLYEIPEFREYQSAMTKRQQELERQAAELAARERESRLSKMNDYEKQKFLAQEAQQRAQALEQRLQYMEALAQREADIKALSQKTGAPEEMLMQAATYIEASELAVEWVAQNADKTVKEKVKAALSAQKANQPDMGGGAPKSPLSAKEERVQVARNQRNAKDFVAAILMGDEE